MLGQEHDSTLAAQPAGAQQLCATAAPCMQRLDYRLHQPQLMLRCTAQMHVCAADQGRTTFGSGPNSRPPVHAGCTCGQSPVHPCSLLRQFDDPDD